jgi:hypothetical protein
MPPALQLVQHMATCRQQCQGPRAAQKDLVELRLELLLPLLPDTLAMNFLMDSTSSSLRGQGRAGWQQVGGG